MMWFLVALVVVAAGLGGLYVYAYRCATRLPDNAPRRFLASRAGSRGDRKVLVCIGDSITHGRVGANYVDMLSERLGPHGVDLVNAGINGELAYNVLQRLDDIIACEPDVITILIGTNDSNKSLDEPSAVRAMREFHLPEPPTAERYRENLTAVCRRLKRETSARIALLSLPLTTEDPSHPAYRHSEEFVEIIRETVKEEGLTYLPLRETMLSRLPDSSLRRPYTFERRERLTQLTVAQHYLAGWSWDRTSDALGFAFLTDFVHLNSRGAGIVAELIEDFVLSEVRSESPA